MTGSWNRGTLLLAILLAACGGPARIAPPPIRAGHSPTDTRFVATRAEWSADALFALDAGRLAFQGWFKLPSAQTPYESCGAHGGAPMPVSGRDILVQGWLQGGVSLIDWTDPIHPMEIAYFDRGPLDRNWYDGHVVASEIARGLDVLEVLPSALLTQNEIDAAKSVVLEELNPQTQPRWTWPPTFALARAYLDQLARDRVMPDAEIASARAALERIERLPARQRPDELRRLAGRIAGEGAPTAVPAKVALLARTLEELAAAG